MCCLRKGDSQIACNLDLMQSEWSDWWLKTQQHSLEESHVCLYMLRMYLCCSSGKLSVMCGCGSTTHIAAGYACIPDIYSHDAVHNEITQVQAPCQTIIPFSVKKKMGTIQSLSECIYVSVNEISKNWNQKITESGSGCVGPSRNGHAVQILTKRSKTVQTKVCEWPERFSRFWNVWKLAKRTAKSARNVPNSPVNREKKHWNNHSPSISKFHWCIPTEINILTYQGLTCRVLVVISQDQGSYST